MLGQEKGGPATLGNLKGTKNGNIKNGEAL